MQEKQQAWFSNPDSLTKRLNEYTQNKIRFVLNKQAWLDEQTWCREISWEYGDKIWVLAKTLIPKNTLGELATTLQKNPSRPIGEILFSGQQWKRGPIAIQQIDSSDDYYQWAKTYASDLPAKLMKRQSTFFNGEKQLTVVEVFMPAFLHL